MAALASTKVPQKKMRTHSDTAIFSAVSRPNAVPSPLRSKSNSTLVLWPRKPQPRRLAVLDQLSEPRVIEWLPRSDAIIRRCQKQGTRHDRGNREKFRPVMAHEPRRGKENGRVRGWNAFGFRRWRRRSSDSRYPSRLRL